MGGPGPPFQISGGACVPAAPPAPPPLILNDRKMGDVARCRFQSRDTFDTWRSTLNGNTVNRLS